MQPQPRKQVLRTRRLKSNENSVVELLVDKIMKEKIGKIYVQWLAEKLDSLIEMKDVSFTSTVFPKNFWNK